MSGFNPCMISHTHGLKICKRGGDIMRRIISRLIQLVLKKLRKKKQPIIQAVNSTVIIIINKD